MKNRQNFGPDDDEALTFVCPNCGTEVKVGSASCPECGSDDRTGWSEEAEGWNPDIPTGYGDQDPDFNYDEFVKREWGTPSDGIPFYRQSGFFKMVVALIVIVVLLSYFIRT